MFLSKYQQKPDPKIKKAQNEKKYSIYVFS